LGVVSCKLYYHLQGDSEVDFSEMSLFSGDAHKGVWTADIDLSNMQGKIILYAEAANTESVLGRTREHIVVKMAAPRRKGKE